MIKNRTIAFFLFAITIVVVASCSILPHPNEKIIVGIWRPIRVEKIVDSSALQAANIHSADTVKNDPKPGKTASAGKGGGGAAGARQGANLDRLAQSEMRATLEMFANKTAVKNYPGNPLHATWKMKGKGTRIIAKGVTNKKKFVIDILSLQQDQMIVMEHAGIGDLKVTYVREK
jgi:hypothetical protein